jgi:hypothetical protein
MLLLSGFMLLGGLALISQVFHIAGRLEDLLFSWLIVFAPTFLIVRNISIYALYEIVAIIYMNVFYFHILDDSGFMYRSGPDRVPFDPATIFAPYQPLLLLVLLMGAAWWIWRRSKEADAGGSPLKRFFVGGATRRIFLSNFLLINWFVWFCLRNSTGRTVLPFVFGVLAIGAVIIFVGRKLDASDLDWQGLLCVGIGGISLSFPSVWDKRYYYSDANYLSAPIASSFILGAYLAYRIVRRDRGGGFAVFLFCSILARWYFDMFYSFMSKSLFFITGGILLLLIAYVYRKWNGMTGKNLAPSGATDIGAAEDDGDDLE